MSKSSGNAAAKLTPAEKLAQMTPQQRIALYKNAMTKSDITPDRQAQYTKLIAMEETKLAKPAIDNKTNSSPVTPMSQNVAPKTLYEMTSEEIVEACKKMMSEHRDAALAFKKAETDLKANPIARATEDLLEVHKVQQALTADASEEYKSRCAEALTKAGQTYGEAQVAEKTCVEARSKLDIITKKFDFIKEAESELRLIKCADHDLYTDIQAWLVNNKIKDFLIPDGVTRIKGAEGAQIFIDAHGNIIADNFIGNFFSFDPTSQMLTVKIGGGSITAGQSTSLAGVSVTFNKPKVSINIDSDYDKIFINGADLKIKKIEGKCQVFLVGQDPHDRISYDEASGCITINPYLDPHAPLEIAAASSSVASEVVEGESASSKIASSALPESASASSSSAQSSQGDNVVEESKATFMSTLSHYIEILKATSQSQEDSASAGAPTYSAQYIDSAGGSLLEFATNNQYLDDKDYSDLIGQAKAVLHLE